MAIKTIDKLKFSKQPKELIALQREIYTARMALHESCSRVLDVFEGVKEWFIVMEYCETDVLSWLIDNDYKLSEKVCREIIKQVAFGIDYMHHFGIVHRDLKLENILISKRPKDKNEVPLIKIADFGLSIVLGPN